MKKAQWKETPRDRAFGVPRHSDIEKLQMQVADLMARLTQQVQRNEIWQDRVSQLKEQIDAQSKRAMALADIHRAYKFLRITGVVMEHEGEFKHLQGEDMDKFFGITQRPPELPRDILRSNASKITTPLSMQDAAYQLIQKEFERSYAQMVEEKWQALQKP